MHLNLDILDHTPIGHFVLRHDYVVMFWNRCLEDWTGISKEEITGRNLIDVFPHLQNRKFLGRINQVLDGSMQSTVFSSQLHRYMIPAPLPNGELRTQYVVVTRLRPEGEEDNLALFSIQDVTDLTAAIHSNRNAIQRISRAMDEVKETERQLAEKSTYLDNILRSATEYGIITTDLDFRITYYNPKAEALFSCTAEEKIGSSLQQLCMDICHIGTEFEAMIDQVLHRGEYNFTISGGEGEARTFVDVRVSGILNHDNHIVGVALFCMDVTEERRRNDKLRILSQAIEQAGESIIITDRNGLIQYANPAFTRLTGYHLDEAIGHTPRLLKSGKQNEQFYEDLWETVGGGRVWQRLLVDRKKDGSLYSAMMSVAPIVDDHGQITHYVGIQQDMTEHQALEERFRQAQKMEAIGTLVGGIAHDFNNMLAGITGNVYLAAQKAKESPEVMQRLDVIRELSFKAATMIQQLLTFARKGIVDQKPFGLTSFLREAAKLNQAGVPENIHLSKCLSGEELVIRGDVTQLQQVVMNLLSNAVDAVEGVEKPEITLGLELKRADEIQLQDDEPLSGDYAHLFVSDNGRGIHPSALKNIFEPFYTTKDVGKGTGLGLAMTYGAVKSHQGIIDVVSGEGVGSTFHIYLPLVGEEELIIPSYHEDDVIQGRGETILVVDDNAQVRETSREVLENIGYKVLLAVDGLDAISMVQRHVREIDLIIIDIVMPRLGGVKAAGQILAMNPHIRVIYATGYDKDETLRHEMPSSDALVISKPYTIGTLSHVLHEQLSRAG
ncbi:PAS domain S-box protein [Mariprofundus erugo]|uniref:hybrid sensor histidine kinase/response regulator n=1 Tax=Mariprofundus erugo TaxID=2528639 RepID=UPI0010FE43A3|nr:PAS domain S-box protein [Mariprofundus erugo]TLS76186.1 PAS domain S-box protein [Mariprofundus erugo]